MKKKIIEKEKKASSITKVVTFRVNIDAYTELLEMAKVKQYSVTDYLLSLLNEAHKSGKKSEDIKKKDLELSNQKKEIANLKLSHKNLMESYCSTFGSFVKILAESNVISKEEIQKLITDLESDCDSGNTVACSIVEDYTVLLEKAKAKARAKLNIKH